MSEKRPGIEKVVEWLSGQHKPVVVDIGAHRGKTVGIWLSAGAKMVYAIEPAYDNFVQLALTYDCPHKVLLYYEAIAKVTHKDILYVPHKKDKDRSQGATIFRDTLKGKKRAGKIDGYKKQTVETISLNEFINRDGIKNIDLLKINAEGAEYDMFLERFACPIRAIFISWHREGVFDKPEYRAAYLAAKGRFRDHGLVLESAESRGDHNWEFWREDDKDSSHSD